MIRETVAFFKAAGKRVIYDAEHFFDGCAADPDYALATLARRRRGGRRVPRALRHERRQPPRPRSGEAARAPRRLKRARACRSASTRTTTPAWRWPTPSLAVEAGATHVQGTLVGFGESAAATPTSPRHRRRPRAQDGPASACRRGACPSSRRDDAGASPRSPTSTFDEGMPYVGLQRLRPQGGHARRRACPRTPPPSSTCRPRRWATSAASSRARSAAARSSSSASKRLDPTATKESPRRRARWSRASRSMERLGLPVRGRRREPRAPRCARRRASTSPSSSSAATG